METVRPVLFALALLLLPCFLPAQAAVKSGTRVIRTDGEFQMSQIIAFPEVPDAVRYEVEIERLDGEGFVFFTMTGTETNSAEVSLRAGSYRYRITAYNKMNLIEGVSDWQNFEVQTAVKPEVENYRPFYGLYYEMANPGCISITGQDLYPESEFALVRHRRNFDWSGIDLKKRRGVLFPDTVTVGEDHSWARLDFSRKTLRKGKYDIFVRNPGGLWTLLGRVQIGFRNNADFTYSFGYAPMIAAFDYEKATYTDWNTSAFGYSEKQTLNFFNPRGAYMRWGWFPVKTKIGSFGLEATVNFLADNSWEPSSDNPFDILSAISSGYGNLTYQHAFTGRWQLDVRAGAGGGDYYLDYDYETDDMPPLLLNFGASAQFFIWKNLYAEAGLDFNYTLGVDVLMIRPMIGLGWQFGRWAEYAEVEESLKRGKDPSVPVTDIPKDEFTLSVGWSPMIPLFGMDYKAREYSYSPYPYLYGVPDSYHETTLLWPVNPMGVYIRGAYIPFRWGNNKLGFEFALYILEHPNRVEWTEDSGYTYVDLLRQGLFDILYQRKLEKDWQLNVRIGVGISNPYDFGNDVGVNIPFMMNTGVSVQRFLWKGLYAEAGIDFSLSFGRFFGRVNHGMLNPGVGIGWQFNRDAETGLRLK
ncbi:MAG: hypothetical protein LBQ55_11245 [Treponema sp.]|jgi:hypothetical protein|nr:hypothetical protein [Treponema sp.]